MKVILFLPVLVLMCMSGVAQPTGAPLPKANNQFIVISHRGNHVQVPENTVAAIEAAIHAGADYAEIDLRTSKDGFLVISHDATVDRMTNGKGNVKDFTLAELKQLKIRSRDSTDNTVYRIPEFREILAACEKAINIYLDFKEADVAETFRQLKAAGMEKKVVVYLNKENQYPEWRKVAPDVPLMTSVPDKITTKEQLHTFLNEVHLRVVDNLQDPAMMEEARQQGVSVWLDVEGPDENPALWKLAMEKGIQGMQTDHPEALVRYLLQHQLRNGLK